MKRVYSLLFVLLVLSVCSVTAQKKDIVELPGVVLEGTQILNLHSDITGKEYELKINLPSNYDKTKSYPTLYVLDAQWDFPLVYSIYGELYFDGMVPGMVTVGITWGGENPNHDSLRAQDFTPSNNMEIPQSGGGPKFLKFIKEELVPFIESRFSVSKDDRTLMGSSFGGLYTLYSLFTETELFDKYILTSSAIDWDNGSIYKTEKIYYENHTSLPIKLYMTMGALEFYPVFEKFVELVKQRNYEGLQMETSILSNTKHSGTKAEGFSRGMRFVYKTP